MTHARFASARLLALTALTATLAACGGGGDTPAPTAVLGASQTAAPPAAAVPPAAAAPAPAPGPSAQSTQTMPKTSIVGMASTLPGFSNLVAALQFASEGGDLVSLLSAPGTFTVFAPTDEAFDALARERTRNPAATAANLLVPANKALVRAVLQYHVLGATVRKADVPLGAPIDPVLAGNDTFRIDAAGDALVITDARFRTSRIVATDVTANNGVVHAIDRVILPPVH